MTVVNPKSISGINSITTGSGSDNLLTIHTSDASNTERFRIDSTGTTKIVTGIVTTLTATTGIATDFTANKITLPDSSAGSINVGLGSDLVIYHDGSNSFIKNSTGNLRIQDANGNIQIQAKAGEESIIAKTDGAVELYYDNSKKLDTVSEGISVTGTVKINNTSSVGDYNGGADDMLIGTHSGNHGMTILSGTSNGGYIMFSDNNGGGTNAYRGQIEYAHSSDYMRFMTNSAEALRIDSSGRVLIGTTDVGGGNADDLTIATSGNTGITIRSGTSNTGNIFWSDATSGADQYIGALEYHHSDNQFKFNISNTTRMTVDSTGDVTVSDGDLVIGTSGHGIDFSATGGPTNGSGTSELFDDYEEGTFAPYYSGDSGGGNYAYSRQAGIYTKIGNTVYYSFYITTNVVNANASGNLIITGLPFTSGSNNEHYQAASIGYYASWNNTYPSHALCDVNNTRIYIYKNHPNSNISHAVPTDVTNGTSLTVSGHYHVA